MTYDSEAIDAAVWVWADAYCEPGKNIRDCIEDALLAAAASMKARGVDPCAEARLEERERNIQAAEIWESRHYVPRLDGPAEVIRALEDEKLHTPTIVRAT